MTAMTNDPTLGGEHEALVMQRGLRALLGHDVDVCVEDRVVVLDFADARTLVRLAFASGVLAATPPVSLTIPTTPKGTDHDAHA